MAKIKVKFNALSYRGKPIQFVEKYECPDFEIIGYNVTLITGRYAGLKSRKIQVSVEKQQDDFIHEMDKSELLIKHDLLGIVDWKIVIPTPPKPSHKSIIAHFLAEYFNGEHKEQLQLDFMAAFKSMEKALRGLHVEKKILLVLKAMSIGYCAAIESHRAVAAEVEERMKLHRENKHPSEKSYEELIEQYCKDMHLRLNKQDYVTF